MSEAKSLGEIVLYQTADGGPALEVRLDRDTVWLDAHQMAALFERDRTVIVRHIRTIYATGELDRTATCAKNAQAAADGKVCQSASNFDPAPPLRHWNGAPVLNALATHRRADRIPDAREVFLRALDKKFASGIDTSAMLGVKVLSLTAPI